MTNIYLSFTDIEKIKKQITKKLFSTKEEYGIIKAILWYKEESNFDPDTSLW